MPFGYPTCQDYWDATAEDMQDLSFKTMYLLVALIFCSMIGSVIMFTAFGTATERINKKVRDKSFRALIRQEVAWYDVRSVGQITSQLSDDAAMIHSFSGEPIRTFMMSISSVGAGLIVSFYFMWEVRSLVDNAGTFMKNIFSLDVCITSTVCFCGPRNSSFHGLWRVRTKCANDWN